MTNLLTEINEETQRASEHAVRTANFLRGKITAESWLLWTIFIKYSVFSRSKERRMSNKQSTSFFFNFKNQDKTYYIYQSDRPDDGSSNKV
jgi:hypothetical protein